MTNFNAFEHDGFNGFDRPGGFNARNTGASAVPMLCVVPRHVGGSVRPYSVAQTIANPPVQEDDAACWSGTQHLWINNGGIHRVYNSQISLVYESEDFGASGQQPICSADSAGDMLVTTPTGIARYSNNWQTQEWSRTLGFMAYRASPYRPGSPDNWGFRVCRAAGVFYCHDTSNLGYAIDLSDGSTIDTFAGPVLCAMPGGGVLVWDKPNNLIKHLDADLDLVWSYDASPHGFGNFIWMSTSGASGRVYLAISGTFPGNPDPFGSTQRGVITIEPDGTFGRAYLFFHVHPPSWLAVDESRSLMFTSAGVELTTESNNSAPEDGRGHSLFAWSLADPTGSDDTIVDVDAGGSGNYTRIYGGSKEWQTLS